MTYMVFLHSGECLGLMDEDVVRPLISRKEARPVRPKFKKDGDTTIVVLSATVDTRVKLLNTGHAGPALRTVQVEEVYTGCRKEQAVTVTGRVRTLMKVRDGRFVPWGENDVFPANRFNPDKIRHPLYAR